MQRAQADADRDIDMDFLIPIDERGLQQAQNFVRGKLGMPHIHDAIQDQGKAVISDTRHIILLADNAAQQVGELSQDLIPGRVAEDVVDSEESVDVDNQQSQLRLVGVRIVDLP